MTTGREALRIFHDEQVKLFGVTYSLDEMILKIGPKWFVDSLTNYFEIDENMTPTRINKAMLNLARISNGKIPNDYQVINKALIDQAQSFDFKAFSEVAQETIKETTNVVTKSVIAYGAYKYLALLIPLCLFIYSEIKGKK